MMIETSDIDFITDEMRESIDRCIVSILRTPGLYRMKTVDFTNRHSIMLDKPEPISMVDGMDYDKVYVAIQDFTHSAGVVRLRPEHSEMFNLPSNHLMTVIWDEVFLESGVCFYICFKTRVRRGGRPDYPGHGRFTMRSFKFIMEYTRVYKLEDFDKYSSMYPGLQRSLRQYATMAAVMAELEVRDAEMLRKRYYEAVHEPDRET